MKKLILRISTIATIIVGLSSCNKFDDQTNNNSGTPTNPTDTTDPVSLGEWIDLGLPSGLLWYSVNLGASSPSDVGDKYAWGETWTKTTYNWSTYHYYGGLEYNSNAGRSIEQMTKYNADDGLTTLEPQDDAATVALGGDARMPTVVEWQELMDNTVVDWTSLNGQYGRKFTSLSNGRSLFLPSTGETNSYPYKAIGEYWLATKTSEWESKSKVSEPPYYRYSSIMYFANDEQSLSNNLRYIGHPIRAVRSVY